jgi:hypothetical protein
LIIPASQADPEFLVAAIPRDIFAGLEQRVRRPFDRTSCVRRGLLAHSCMSRAGGAQEGAAVRMRPFRTRGTRRPPRRLPPLAGDRRGRTGSPRGTGGNAPQRSIRRVIPGRGGAGAGYPAGISIISPPGGAIGRRRGRVGDSEKRGPWTGNGSAPPGTGDDRGAHVTGSAPLDKRGSRMARFLGIAGVARMGVFFFAVGEWMTAHSADARRSPFARR